MAKTRPPYTAEVRRQAPMLWLRSPDTRKELGIADAFTPFAALTLGYAASVPPPRSRERPEIAWA
jgi:hypothetical protein